MNFTEQKLCYRHWGHFPAFFVRWYRKVRRWLPFFVRFILDNMCLLYVIVVIEGDDGRCAPLSKRNKGCPDLSVPWIFLLAWFRPILVPRFKCLFCSEWFIFIVSRDMENSRITMKYKYQSCCDF